MGFTGADGIHGRRWDATMRFTGDDGMCGWDAQVGFMDAVTQSLVCTSSLHSDRLRWAVTCAAMH